MGLSFKILLFMSILYSLNVNELSGGIPGANIFDVRYWSCFLKRHHQCPDNDIKFYVYTDKAGQRRNRVDPRSNLALDAAGWNPHHNNVIIIHGFNSSHQGTALTRLRNAYLSRHNYNVFMVEWHQLARFPCYVSALSNMKLVAQCTSQLYAYMMDMGGRAKKTTCVGHSLGAHICGMISNHLNEKQYKIVGLDPARPLIEQFGNPYFRLSKEDAHQVTIIHSNAGLLGERGLIGHVDFCVNGGRMQPGCKGHMIRRSRCSHFQSVCYYSQSIINASQYISRPCTESCPKKSGLDGVKIGGKTILMGPKIPMSAHGQYCVAIDHDQDCAFN